MSYTGSAAATLRKYGQAPIESLTLYRAPVAKAIARLANAVSLGTIKEKQLSNQAPDEFFHLVLVVKLLEQNTTIGIEKLDNITLTQHWKPPANAESCRVPYDSSVTLQQLMDRGRAYMGARFWVYDAFTNNCQTFVSGLLHGSRLMNDHLDKWTNQDTSALVLGTPKVSRQVLGGLTDLGRVAGKALDSINRTMDASKSDEIARKNVNRTEALADDAFKDDYFHNAEQT